MENTPSAYSSLCVHAKTDKFRFAENGMQNIRRRRNAGLQSHPHIRTVREPFGALVYTRLYSYISHIHKVGNELFVNSQVY